MLSLDNIEELGKVKLPGDRVLEFILAVPGRRYGDFVELLQDFQRKAADAADEVIGEVKWRAFALVVAHQPDKAKEQSQLRNARIAEIETKPRSGRASSTARMRVNMPAGASSATAGPRRGCTTRCAMRIWRASSRSISRASCLATH